MFLALRSALSKIKYLLNSKIPHFRILVIILLIFGLGVGTGYVIFTRTQTQIPQTQVQKDPDILFLDEIYDKILENYWDNISSEQLAQQFRKTAEQLTGKPQKMDFKGGIKSPSGPNQAQIQGTGISLDLSGTSINDLKVLTKDEQLPKNNVKQPLDQMLKNILKELADDKKGEFVKTLAAQVLANLQPAGRSGLFTQKQEENLKNTVQNINPEKDLYQDLGLNKGASSEAVQQAYQQKEEQLKKVPTPQAKEQLKQLAYAKDVLTDKDKKKNYDTAKIEPTTGSRLITPEIAYLQFIKFSPTTYEEFVKIVSSYEKPDGPKALIFDLRGNIGGAIDAVPFFLGNFLGDKQYIYDFMRKGESEPYKTVGNKLGGLARMRQVVILVDNQTQSSAELLVVALKRYHFGVVLGAPTKGWGTVEKVFPLNNQIDKTEKYSLFLVHSITLRDDNQPIEGRGVEPHINITSPDWEKQLNEYFRYPELTSAVKSVI